MTRKIRVLVVDDSTVIRRLLTDVLMQDANIEVVGTAANGIIALAKIVQLNPDVVTLDIEMPEMDGIETVKEIRKKYLQLPVIMFSTLTQLGAEATLDALSLGANDYVTKPANTGSVTQSREAVKQQLIPKIKGLCQWFRESVFVRPTPVQHKRNTSLFHTPVAKPTRLCQPEIVAIGVSTGGPNALATLLSQFPSNFPLPILIVQHMPPVFTQHLAARLDQQCRLVVKEAAHNDIVRPGSVYIAPGDRHMTTTRKNGVVSLALNSDMPENSCRPAVDVLFRSTAEIYGRATLGVVLTGMGRDGVRGSEAIKAVGGTIFTQDQASSVVWGMPGAVVERGLADDVIELEKMALAIEKICCVSV